MIRPFTILDVEQRSAPWFAARCGKLTGTCAGDLLARIKTGEAAARRDLRIRLVVERLTGIPQEDGFINADMKRGTDLQGDARAAYEADTGALVRDVGFLVYNDLPVGYSPDGVIGDVEGLLELKVPRSATHLRYLRSDAVPSEHLAQVTHGLFVSGADYCDFASWDPRFPPELQLVIRRVTRTDVDLQAYELALRLFLAEVQKEYEDVAAMVKTRAVA